MSIEITSHTILKSWPINKLRMADLEGFDYQVFFTIDALPSSVFMVEKDCETAGVWDEAKVLAWLEANYSGLLSEAEATINKEDPLYKLIKDLKGRTATLEVAVAALKKP